MECGDPRGETGRGFIPIDPQTLQTIKDKKLSLYSCHAPMDTNRQIGTNEAIVQALDCMVIEEFLPYGLGFAGRICGIKEISLDGFIEKLKQVFNIPYVDFGGQENEVVKKIALVAGGGTDVNDMKLAEQKGCDTYLSGEIFNRIDNDYGKNQFRQNRQFSNKTKMSLIGVSHAGSEFLVMKTQMKEWLVSNFRIEALPIHEDIWWR